jgi:Putative F0F1-ATPase subunit Ca2+/Mg2+ transporter
VLEKSLQYTHLSLQMMVIIGAGIWLGMQLDAYLRLTFPVFMSILALASTTYAVYAVIRTLAPHPPKNT